MSQKISKNNEKFLSSYDEHCRSIEQTTHVNVNDTPQEKRKKRKELEKDYVKWFEEIFPQYAKVPCAPFHKKLAKLIIENDVVDVLAEIYRSGAKSVHLSLGIPMFLYVTGKLRFMLLASQSEDKAKKLISDIQANFSHNQRFFHYYGKRYKFGDWSNGDFTTTDGAKFMALSASQSPRGLREGNSRPDYIVIDDVDTRQRCNNDELSKKLFDWAWEDLKGTFDEGSPRRRFIVANNNFHKNTLINQLKKEFQGYIQKAKESGFTIRHFIVSVPAVKNLSTFEPSWAEKTSADYWREKFATTPYRSFMREYQHIHIVEGSIFKNEFIEYCTPLKLNKYEALVFYGDLSYKDAGDFKAMVFVGKIGLEFHVLDCFVRQTSKNNTALWLYDKVAHEGLLNLNVNYWIEGLFAMDDFVNDFDNVGAQLGWYIPVRADKKSKSDKFDRIESMAGYFERGKVKFSKSLENSNDFKELLNQLLAFQKGSGAHDDAPDALQSAIVKLNTASIINTIPPKMVSRKETINNQKNRF